MNHRFIADVHLGKLARLLRMLGFDVVYDNAFTNAELISIAIEQNRILLSRNEAFGKDNSFQSFLIIDEEPDLQLTQVIKHFELKKDLAPFTRCIVCNGLLQSISKEEIKDKLLANAFQYFNEFCQCSNCGRIYWKGSHYERMKKLVEKFLSE